MTLGLLLVVDLLAAYRLTRLVVDDTFPPVKWLRDRIVAAHTTVVANPGGGTVDKPGALAELVQCPWCAGFWVSVLVVAAHWAVPEIWLPVSLVLALSAGVGIVSQLVDSEG